MLRLIAEVTGIDVSRVKARRRPSCVASCDAQLDCSRLDGLLKDADSSRLPFRDGLARCLAHLSCTRPTLSVCSGGDSVNANLPAHHNLSSAGTAPMVDSLAEAQRWHAERQEAQTRFRDELKARGAALQELFWEELERTRNRLRDAGYLDANSAHLRDIANAAVAQAKPRGDAEEDVRGRRGMSPLRSGAAPAGNGAWQHDKREWGTPIPAPHSPLRRNSPVPSPWGRRTFNPGTFNPGRAGYAADCATVQAEHAKESSRARQLRERVHHCGDVPQPAVGRWLSGPRPIGEEVI